MSLFQYVVSTPQLSAEALTEHRRYKITHFISISPPETEKITNCLEYCREMPIFARERRSQAEPRCAERRHLCDDEQFDLAAWFPSLNTFRPCHSVAGSDSL